MAKMLTAVYLDVNRFNLWLKIAKDKQQQKDPIFSFIAAWIAFNFYYSAYSGNEHNLEFEKWCEKQTKDFGDRSQWLFLINHEEFAKGFYPTFRKHKVLQNTIELPVFKMIGKGAVPSGRKHAQYRWHELLDEEIFEVLYQVRNNLFHGQKHINDPRDQEILSAACDFMIPFLVELINATQTK
jgi:hypothetical protein